MKIVTVKNGIILGSFLIIAAICWNLKTAVAPTPPALPTDEVILNVIDQALKDPTSIDKNASPLNQQISDMVETYKNMWPAFEKVKDSIDITKGQGTSTPLGWCDCEGMPISKRMLFVLKIVTAVENKFPDRATKIFWTSLGSGNLLQDFLILQQLVLAGYTKIHLNVIDGHFKNSQVPIIQAFNGMKKLLEDYRKKTDAQLNPSAKINYDITINPFPSVTAFLTGEKSSAFTGRMIGGVPVPSNLKSLQPQKSMLITVADVHPLHDDAGNNPDNINVVTVDNLYDIFLSPTGKNFAYIRNESPLATQVNDIVKKPIRDVTEIKKLLEAAAKEYPQLRYASNAFYDFKRLLDAAAPHAIAYAIYPLYNDKTREEKTTIHQINPTQFAPDDYIVEQLETEGQEPFQPFDESEHVAAAPAS
jgi:hypothetical protein